ncbi:hypothetical protein NUU61_007208 [Penicillium alfredii]|uniref:Uncharacterized protein n=1 Tax=Penicillium alfredii TaxID=1506179 RepID=A0A9W9K413_9EURO|nr:uncharacterized protein NUU61_007208 [Penicillium alfredii]KAJ5092338.1 hypothetical protein NUU61_007208 [Penicillium alfredii]
MDGDHRMKQHERLMAPSGNAAHSARTHRFDPAMHPRGDPTSLSQAPDRVPMPYDYGYTGPAFHSGALQQPNEVQTYAPEYARHAQHPQAHSLQRRRAQPQGPAQFLPYDSAMLYGFGGQGAAQGPYEVVPQYPPRQSAAMDALSNQFAVPQYFAPEEPSGSGVSVLSPYLNAQLQPYNGEPGSMARPNSSQPFPATMSDFTQIGTASASRLDPSQQPQQQHQKQQQQQQPEPQPQASDPSNLDEAYTQYQHALRSTFDHTRAGRLAEASRSLLEISEWIVTNARDLGILRDDRLLYSDRLKLWNNFNLCWLAVCQKQKDLTHDLITTGQQPAQNSILSRDRMDAMGKDLIQLCDQLEQHGLVDYQMGIWEEEILCSKFGPGDPLAFPNPSSDLSPEFNIVLGQCLDLMESRPELLHMASVPEPAAAAPRP